MTAAPFVVGRLALVKMRAKPVIFAEGTGC